MLARHADDGELVAHDCGLHGNPSHTGVDDLEREYPAALRARMLLYHYASPADAQALAARGHAVARPARMRRRAPPTPAVTAAAGQRSRRPYRRSLTAAAGRGPAR